MSTSFAIDPGNTRSAFVVLDNWGKPCRFGKTDNTTLLAQMSEWSLACPGSMLAIEMIASYGMPVGAEVFETCVWVGRFIQAWHGPHVFVYRREVKLNLCGSMKAKDGNVRQALIDRFGGKATAVGTKKQPGPLYGFAADAWSALAVGVTYIDTAKQAGIAA